MAYKNLGVTHLKKITLFLWKDVKTSLVLLALRFTPLKALKGIYIRQKLLICELKAQGKSIATKEI
jgi:hypothetical protein